MPTSATIITKIKNNPAIIHIIIGYGRKVKSALYTNCVLMPILTFYR